MVAEGDELDVELLEPENLPVGRQETAVFEALLLINGDKTTVGNPVVGGTQVKADVVEQIVKDDKVTAIRYKAKKRVHKRRGHRQRHTRIKIKAIELKS